MIGWLRRRAENVAVAMLTAMFATFLLQIVARYFLTGAPGWTVELCLTLWLWLVLWASAFCLKDHQHVKFDMLYLAVGQRWQRVFAALSALLIVAVFLAALPADWDYIDFYKRKKSGVMKIQLRYVFSIYAIFAVAVIGAYGWRLWRILKGDDVEGVAVEHLAENLLRDGTGEGGSNGS